MSSTEERFNQSLIAVIDYMMCEEEKHFCENYLSDYQPLKDFLLFCEEDCSHIYLHALSLHYKGSKEEINEHLTALWKDRFVNEDN